MYVGQSRGHLHPSDADASARRSGSVAELYDRKIDLGLQRLVDGVGERVERNVRDDFQDLAIGVASLGDRQEIGLVNVAALARQLAARRTAASAFGSIDAPLRLAVNSASSRRAKFLPR